MTSTKPRWTRRWFSGALVLVLAALVAACSSNTTPSAAPAGTTSPSTPAGGSAPPGTVARASGPMADLSEELTAGQGIALGSSTKVDMASVGYTEHEYVAAGTATSYKAVGALGADGRWTFEDDTTAPYRTRAIVRRPANDADFSGTVIVEWINVSSGYDADVMWADTHEEITRNGDAWVGLSAQMIGVSGGPVLTPIAGGPTTTGGIVAGDPARYGTLTHPGDAFAFDIYTQVARAVRDGVHLPAKPAHVIAAGQSQSAIALVTYLNGVQPLTHAFDGFIIHSRGARAMPLVPPGQPANLTAAGNDPPPIIRTDTEVPVIDVQAEGDLTHVLNSLPVRQDDSATFRLWEVAGTSHADAHTLGAFKDAIQCGLPVNDGPSHIVMKAALHAIEAWVADGTAPATAPRIEVTGTGSDAKVGRDANGIAKGGVRTPPVDVPVDVLSGDPGPDPGILCQLFGSTVPLTAEQIAALHPSREAYLSTFTAAVDDTIKKGFAVAADREALLAYAQPDRIG